MFCSISFSGWRVLSEAPHFGDTQLASRKLASFCLAFHLCPVTCCGNVKSYVVKPSCHSPHESLTRNSLTLAMVAVVTVVGFAVVSGLVHAADAACGKPQVVLSLHPTAQGRMATKKRASLSLVQALSTQDSMAGNAAELQARMQSQPQLAGQIILALRSGFFEDKPVPVCTAIAYCRLGRPNCWST